MKRTYSQIDLDERRKIERWRHAGVTVDIIAEKLGRHRSTIFREIARNKFEDREMPELTGYFCVTANGKSKERRSRHRKLVRHPQLRASLVERVSRFTVFLRNNDRQSKPIMDGLIDALGPLPHAARRSITFDRGTEFTDWPYLQAGLGVQTWFCDPQAPWQKGTVENTNRRARRWLSRDTDPLSIEHQDLHQVCAHLNSTPRKCLGFKTPAEVFRHKLLAASQ